MPTANQNPGVDPWSPDPPEPKVPLDAYRREEFVEPPEEVESEEMIGQEPSVEPPSEPDETKVGDEDEQATPSTNEPTIETQIAEAEAAGDWLRSGQLKVQRMNLQVQGESQETQTESDGKAVANLVAEIQDAATNADWYASGLAKFELMSKRAAIDPLNAFGVAAPTPSSDQDQDLQKLIHDAESEGRWGEALALKARRIPGMSL